MQLKYVTLCKRVIPILNSNLPSCIDCIHFIDHKTNYSYESLADDGKYGICKLFGKKNIITGEIKYLSTEYCREDPQLCGKEAIMKETK